MVRKTKYNKILSKDQNHQFNNNKEFVRGDYHDEKHKKYCAINTFAHRFDVTWNGCDENIGFIIWTGI